MSATVHSDASSSPRSGMLGMSWRQLTVLIALINALVATYLHLWKLGKMGALACGGGQGCLIVQGSKWSFFFGVDVALIGAIGYSLILVIALVGTLERFADSRHIARALLTLVVLGFLFTLRLKWAEFYMLKAFCPWCAISAVSMTLLVPITWLELKRVRPASTS